MQNVRISSFIEKLFHYPVRHYPVRHFRSFVRHFRFRLAIDHWFVVVDLYGVVDCGGSMVWLDLWCGGSLWCCVLYGVVLVLVASERRVYMLLFISYLLFTYLPIYCLIYCLSATADH